MKKLKLNFLENPHMVDKPNLVEIIEKFGIEICEYGKEYFSYAVTTTGNEGVLYDISLYILALEIGYEYKVINVKIKNISKLEISFFTLVTKQTERFIVDISKDTSKYEEKLSKLLSNPLFNESLKFLVAQIHLKRDYNNNVRGQIRIGAATTATLHNGKKINVGFQRIEGDEVIYYTAKGLREIWKPDMSKEAQKEADRLKKLSEKELIKGHYMERKKISDFKQIDEYPNIWDKCK